MAEKVRVQTCSIPNYFASAEVAERYALVRPFFHDEAARRIRELAGVERFGRALDVGCGAGQSSIALADIADQVIAIDASQSMLDQAPLRANVSYRRGVAEELEFEDGEFDLVSVGSALHWFDQQRFYGECQRVLTKRGVLAVYNDHFTAHLQDVVACKRWMRTRFAKRFRAARRGMRDMDELMAVQCGFDVAHRCSFSHVVAFSRAEFIDYLLTRSNTLAAIQSGKETQDSAREWMDGELSPIIPDGVSGEFIFKCNLWLLQKTRS